MTLGELALWHRHDAGLKLDLTVVEAAHWQRAATWADFPTQKWNAPSPNIPDFETARWYPGLCLCEFFDVSVGRGTEWPFRVIGAPSLDASLLAQAMDSYQSELHNFRWEAVTFTPAHSKHAGEVCTGLQFERMPPLTEVEHDEFEVVVLGMALLAALHASHKVNFDEEEMKKCLPLLGSRTALQYLLAGDVRNAKRLADADASQWRERREPFLLYA
jgi:uncharacterized protein YbbC (DUF1343 family)